MGWPMCWERRSVASVALAVPGCFATAAELALYPLARAGLSTPPALFAVTGSSGAGAHPKATTHHPTRAHNLFAYSALGHRHEAEIAGCWREWTGNRTAGARLMTHSGPFVRGIYLTTHVQLAGNGDKAARGRGWFAMRIARCIRAAIRAAADPSPPS